MMNIGTQKLLAAMGMLLCCGAQASGDQLQFSELEQRLAALEARVASQNSLQTASYLSDATPATYAGGYHAGDEAHCCPQSACCDTGGAYATFEFLWLRPHVSEDWVGKLSESHHLSSRTVVGYENCCGLGARARYWHFDHTIDVLDPDTIGMNVEVVDLEVTNRFGLLRSDLLLAGGFRYAHWNLEDQDGTPVAMDAYGLTVAADARTPLYTYCANRLSFVYGARWSVLGGDWRGDNDIIDTVVRSQVRDDNILVTELYAGVEYLYRWCDVDLFARTTAEMQNWRSDVLGEPGIGNGIAPLSIGSTNSISFVGVGLQLGVGY